ncbi:TetR/AcrR family transcriptional regulator [Bacillus paralicheniformis]|uniref:TetR/AcrR family transcriptional regulator n=1 Tax=Bacillus paralicheniformis TaxID=1648923 RepID=UPI00065332AC|nr:TetR/AcrR family transcriptional regulator [Bacillus paralicheniformis]KRT90883.1 TetR family transcriptional regulator [Bacillus paralicheniformis]MCM3424800.1 TetR/AcrR family transcriptional regulator [Bacillus paralicheniformis]
MEDRRSIKTKRAIKEAFLKLLHEKEINKITVSDLSRRADLGRGTFYLHYKDIFDLYEQIENELFDQLGRFYDDYFPSEDPHNLLTFIEKTTEYIYQNAAIFTLLTKPKGNILTINKFKDFFQRKIFEELSMIEQSENEVTCDEMEISFVVSGVVGVLEEWINEGMVQTPSHVAGVIHRILLKIGV